MDLAEIARNLKKSKKAKERRATKKAKRSQEQALANYIEPVKKRKHNEHDSSTVPASEGQLTDGVSTETPIKRRKVDDSILSSPQAHRDQSDMPQESPRLYTSKAEKKAARKAARAAAREREQNSSILTSGLSGLESSSALLPTTQSIAALDSAIPSISCRKTTEIKGTVSSGDRQNTAQEELLRDGPGDTATVGNQSASSTKKRKRTKENVRAADAAEQDLAHDDSATVIESQPPVNHADLGVSNIESISDQHDGSEDDSHVHKAKKALQRYLTRSNTSIRDFVNSLENESIRKSPFFNFAKKYFAKMSRNDFGSLVRQVALELLEADVEKTSSLSEPTQLSVSSPAPLEISAQPLPNARKLSVEVSAKDIEKDVQNEQAYISGPLSEAEQGIIHDAVRSYCSDHDLTHSEFCNIVWDLPRPLDKLEKRRFNAEFLNLLPNRKIRNVREWFKRAYIPYDRSPFTTEDDKEILRLHAQYGADWKKIAAEIGRYREDVRDRYRNFLAAGEVNMGEWSVEENAQFEDILKKYNDRSELNWGVVAKLMGTRSRAQCRDRYMRINGEKTSSITALRRQLRGVNVRRTTISSSSEPGTYMTNFVAGDILCLAKIMKANQVTSIEEAIERKLFFTNKYNEVYSDSEIHIKMQSELQKTGRGYFVTKLDRLIEKYEALDESELVPSIVDV